MGFEPSSSRTRHLIQGARLLEEMRCPFDDHELLYAAQLGERCPVQINHRMVVAPDNEQGGRMHIRQGGSRQIRPAASGDHGPYHIGTLRRCHQRRGCACAGSEITDRKVPRMGIVTKPFRCPDKALREQFYIEPQVGGPPA
jgi:hypothetical protein